jgi:predicted ferric reductase
MALICTGIWFLDRSLRFSRWLCYSLGNYATLTPLPEGATRVTMRRGICAAPGSHAFLYIPGIRALQAHPFTMVGREPVEFVIAARGGFTKSLHEMACEKPGRVLRASVEGPYGNVPDVHAYDRVVLVVGGSGATFALALAKAWIKENSVNTSEKTLEMVWSIKSAGKLCLGRARKYNEPLTRHSLP